jgi:DNA-binding SARP family transcriptional activator
MTTRLLRLMGPPKLTQCDEIGTETPQRLSPASLSLLALMAMQGPDGMARAVVAETLWPGVPPEKSGSRLSSAVWRAQDADGVPLLTGEGGQIALAPGARITVDIADLARRTAALRRQEIDAWRQPEVAALEAALSRRSGGFLDGLEGDWLTAARQRCTEIYEAALETLIRYHRHHGHVDRSIAAARQLVRHDPYREDMQAVLVELYGRKGQRGRAVSQFASARDLLRSDLGVEPGEALTRSLRAVLDRQTGLADREVLERLRQLDDNVARLSRQISEIRGLLARQVWDKAAE